GKCGRGSPATILSVVIAGLDPAIHVAAPHCRVYGCHPAALITDGRVILGVKPEERRPRIAPSDGRVNITPSTGTQAREICSTCRWSVPQQPPSTRKCPNWLHSAR